MGGGGWVPPLVLFKKSIFGQATLKLFQRRLWRQYILILTRERAPKKRDFFIKIFQKESKNAFFGLFSQNVGCGAENLGKTGTKSCLGRAQKINSLDLKKSQQNFLKIRPLKKILDPPLIYRQMMPLFWFKNCKVCRLLIILNFVNLGQFGIGVKIVVQKG